MKKETIRFGSLVAPVSDYDPNSPSEMRLRKKSIAILKNLKLAGHTKSDVLKMRKFGRASIDSVFG